ncbi:hypothetical protein WNY51_18150 [Pseudocolwellia sp. AS88]|uniref:hypothetical protein n=1 Tax=Pseudocolwellia sp. AS88 TaxID=3063958 RepID=UPI0026F14E32|nr:hypothetical protein [Pseudocolwellia sp. AS88]MDO7085523.1 hypothetical protein [Pseudocolwellia sp. AS88]
MRIELGINQVKLKSGQTAETLTLGGDYLITSVNNVPEEFTCTELSANEAVFTPVADNSRLKFFAKLGQVLTTQEKSSITAALQKGIKLSYLDLLNKGLTMGFLALDREFGYRVA